MAAHAASFDEVHGVVCISPPAGEVILSTVWSANLVCSDLIWI